MRNSFAVLTVVGLLTFTGPAGADTTLDFDFLNGVNGVQPNNPEVFSAEGAGNLAFKISADGTGPNPGGPPTQLYVKSSTPDETGLGLTNDPSNHEISAGSFVQLNFTALKALIGTGQLTFSISSVQNGEGFALYGSNSPTLPGSGATALWTMIGDSNTTAIYSKTFSASTLSSYNYFDLTAVGSQNCANPDVLLSSVTVTTSKVVPEPGSVVLLGVGLVGMGGLAWRRRLLLRRA